MGQRLSQSGESCSSVTLARTLSLAFVMIAGPQILSAIFLATSENWRRNSAAFVAGAALSITTIGTIGFSFGFLLLASRGPLGLREVLYGRGSLDALAFSRNL
jgi:ABC-type tungstate transport system substrate-binding protein